MLPADSGHPISKGMFVRTSASAALLLLFTAGCMPAPGGFDHPGPPGGFGPPPGGPGGARGGRLFISPMGEPFRGESESPPETRWFAGADADSDGAITALEMLGDAARFFHMLDADRDGEIEPDEIEHYETVLVPETRVHDAARMPRTGASRPRMPGGPGGGSPGGGGPGGATPDGPPGGGDARSGRREPRQGAARFGYFDLPQPVISADANMNRGVSREEFARAAEQRFAALDRNGDGRLERGELPRISSSPPPRGPGRRSRPPGAQ